MEKTSGNGYKLHWEMFHLNVRKKNFTKNNLSLEQPPQGYSRVLITGGCQHVIGQGAK